MKKILILTAIIFYFSQSAYAYPDTATTYEQLRQIRNRYERIVEQSEQRRQQQRQMWQQQQFNNEMLNLQRQQLQLQQEWMNRYRYY